MKKRIGYSLLTLVAGAILSFGLPHSAKADTVGAPYLTGGVFVTGHDPDYHAYMGTYAVGPRHIIQKAIGYVTNNKPNPKVLLVDNTRNTWSSNVSMNGMKVSGYTSYDLADNVTSSSKVYDLHTVDFRNYDVVVVASDFGGTLTHDDIDILNARSSEILNYVNNGGGLVVFAESNKYTNTQHYGFLPFLISYTPVDEIETGFKVTDVGKALGLTNTDVNGNASHSIFSETGGMDVVDYDANGNIMSLVTRKTLTPAGVDDPPTVTATADRAPNVNGWYNADVTVSFSATDTDKTGVVQTDPSVVVSTEGAGEVIKGSATDSAHLVGWGSLTINLDKTAPVTTPTLSGTAGTTAGQYTSPVTLSLAGTDNLSGVVRTEYRVNGGAWQTYSGAVTFSDLGNYVVDYRSVDAADNVEAINTATFSVVQLDHTPPVTTVAVAPIIGTDNDGIYNTDVTVTFTATDDLSGVAQTLYRINGGAWQTYTGTIPVSTEGAYTIDYYSIDKAGNVEATKTTSFLIDKTPPVVTVTLPTATGDNGWYTSDVPITLSGTDNLSGLSTIEYRINDGPWITYTGSFTEFQDGVYTIEFRGTDVAGNVSTPITVVVKIDRTPPTLQIQLDKTVLWPPNHKMIPIHVTLNASDDSSGIAAVSLISITSNEPDQGLGDGDTANDIQGADYGTADTLFYVRAERSGLGTGRVYTVVYKAVDNAGNVTYATATITVPHDMSNK